LYASRFYPHKNHDFLSSLVDKHQNFFRKNRYRFFVTINGKESPETRAYLKNLSKIKIDDLVVNLGELSRENLFKKYREATCLFHPSKTETFGNTLAEAMKMGLPIVAPGLDYAKEICADAALYYRHDSLDDAFNAIVSLCKDDDLHKQLKEKGVRRAGSFPGISGWWQRLCEICLH
jgi:glycosyltransferase involved in cell wall biosynthesis